MKTATTPFSNGATDIVKSAWEEGYDHALLEHGVAAVKLSGNRCEIHSDHRPMLVETEVHHIWPLNLCGPEKESNQIRVCPTGHSTIHAFIRMLVRGEDLPSGGFKHEKELAHRGYMLWETAGRPKAKVDVYH